MLSTFEDVISRLDAIEVPYMVTGSFAMLVYVPARTTYDVDIVIELTEDDAARFVQIFERDYYIEEKSIRRAIQRRSLFNIISLSTSFKVDCIIRKDTLLEKEKFGRRVRAEVEGIGFWTITAEDLILSKLTWARESLSERQFQDIRALLESGVDETVIGVRAEQEELSGVRLEYERWKTRVEN